MSKFSKYLDIIMPLCLALFFARTVFVGYKYLFFAALAPCFLYSVYVLSKQCIARPKVKTLLLPVLVLALFFTQFSPSSNVVKESMNTAVVVYFIVFSNLYYAEDKCFVFLKWIVRFTMFAGCIAIVRFALSVVGVPLSLCNVFFEGDSFSLVNDSNFYSLFFIISIILSAILFVNGQIKKVEYQIINIVAAINIVAGLSRRAYLLYALVIAVMFVCVVLKKYDFKKSLLYNVLTICIVGVICGGILFLSNGYYSPEMSFVQKNRYYKMYSLGDNSRSFMEFDILQQRKYYYECQPNDPNLFYNGDLQAGMKCWRTDHREPINVSWHNDEAEPFIRIEKIHSDRWWSLIYSGRPIFYKAGVEYSYSFKYRIIQGNGAPFRVGLWVKESKGYIEDLRKEILPFDSVWNICVVRHIFEKDQMNPTCFLNAQKANTIIDIKDICLKCDDTIGLPRYVDQLPDSVIHKYYSQDTINYFTASRTDRWRYALELWRTKYNTQQKIFGRGFDYLEWYGQKFWGNPKRYDFPHNPIISSFLYSGIIGGIVYIIFLIMSLWLYWKRRKELGILFIMYLCCMFFSMFSGSSHFSFPLFAFLSFVPFVEFKNWVATKGSIGQ